MDKEKRMPCEVYSRVVGYLRPVQNWNNGKRQEFKDRKPFLELFKQTEKEEKNNEL